MTWSDCFGCIVQNAAKYALTHWFYTGLVAATATPLMLLSFSSVGCIPTYRSYLLELPIRCSSRLHHCCLLRISEFGLATLCMVAIELCGGSSVCGLMISCAWYCHEHKRINAAAAAHGAGVHGMLHPFIVKARACMCS